MRGRDDAGRRDWYIVLPSVQRLHWESRLKCSERWWRHDYYTVSTDNNLHQKERNCNRSQLESHHDGKEELFWVWTRLNCGLTEVRNPCQPRYILSWMDVCRLSRRPPQADYGEIALRRGCRTTVRGILSSLPASLGAFVLSSESRWLS